MKTLHILLLALAFTLGACTPRGEIPGRADDALPNLSFDGQPLIVNATVVQPDGKILIAGDFVALDGEPRPD